MVRARAPFWVAAEGRHLYLPKNHFLTWAGLGWSGPSPRLGQVKPWAGPGSSPWENWPNFPKGFPRRPPMKNPPLAKPPFG